MLLLVVSCPHVRFPYNGISRCKPLCELFLLEASDWHFSLGSQFNLHML